MRNVFSRLELAYNRWYLKQLSRSSLAIGRDDIKTAIKTQMMLIEQMETRINENSNTNR